MANERVIAITEAYHTWLPSNWAPAGERIAWSYPVQFGLLSGPNVEFRISLNAWCSGLTPPPDPRIRFRLGGSLVQEFVTPLFADVATHGALIGEFNVGDSYFAGDYWNAPRPTFNQDNTKRYHGVFTLPNPGALAYVRMCVMADPTDRGCGITAGRINMRGTS